MTLEKPGKRNPLVKNKIVSISLYSDIDGLKLNDFLLVHRQKYQPENPVENILPVNPDALSPD